MALGKTVRELLRDLDSKEISEWQEFEKLEPFGAVVNDFYQSRLLAFVYNSMRGKHSLTMPFRNLMLSDYEYFIGEKKSKKPEAIKDFFVSMGAKKVKKKRKKKRNKK